MRMRRLILGIDSELRFWRVVLILTISGEITVLCNLFDPEIRSCVVRTGRPQSDKCSSIVKYRGPKIRT